MYEIRSKDGTQVICEANGDYFPVITSVLKEAKHIKRYRTEIKSEAQQVWMCFGGEFADFTVVEI